MRNQLSAHIILACLITILTASGFITKNVSAADEESVHRRLLIVAEDLETGEKIQCPIPLEPPIYIEATNRSTAQRPVRWSITSFYTWLDGNIAASSSTSFQPGTDRPASSTPTEIVDPGPEQEWKAYISILNVSQAIHKPRALPLKKLHEMNFRSLVTGEKCQLDLQDLDDSRTGGSHGTPDGKVLVISIKDGADI